MSVQRASLLYEFAQNLAGRFITIDNLMESALPMISDYLGADSVFFFDWNRPKSIISQRIMCQHGRNYYLQEDIFVDDTSPEVLKLTEDGIIDSPALEYPAVYVLLKWQTPMDSLKTLQSGQQSRSQYGALRVERFDNSRPFTQGDKEILLSIARELSLKMNMTEIDQYNTCQLRRVQALNDLAQVFATSIRLDDSLEQILKNIQNHFGFDRASLYLIDSKTFNLHTALSVDLSGVVRRIDAPADMLKKYCDNCRHDGPYCPAFGASDISISVPLRLQNKNLGCLVFENILSRTPLPQEDVLSLRQFSSQIALAIDNARLFEKVQELSNYDELTKLPLRRFFGETFDKEVYRSKRFNLTFSFIILDIDYFKNINDEYGHTVGDEVLKAISDVIRTSLRQTDMPCRFGGDEIVILLPRTTGEEALNIARRLSAAVAAIKLPDRITRGEKIKLSISQGIAVFPYDGEDQQALIACADDALYYVKQTGRGASALYSDIKDKKKN